MLCMVSYVMMITQNLSFSVIFFFRQKTAYEMRISDCSSDVCSSDLRLREVRRRGHRLEGPSRADGPYRTGRAGRAHLVPEVAAEPHRPAARHAAQAARARALFRSLYRHRAGADPA